MGKALEDLARPCMATRPPANAILRGIRPVAASKRPIGRPPQHPQKKGAPQLTLAKHAVVES